VFEKISGNQMLFPYSTEFVPRKIDTKLKDYESSDNEHIL